MLLLMRLIRRFAPLAIFSLYLIAQPCLAQSLEDLAKERKSINATLSQHKERVDYLVDRIERAKEDVAEAEAALSSQEEKLSKAISKVEENPGDSTTRAATHASIRYNRTEAKSERMQERLENAQAELASIQTHEIELNKRLAEIAIAEQKIAENERKQKAASASTTVKVEQPAKLISPVVAAPQAPVVTIPATWPTAEEETPADAAFAKSTIAVLKSKPAGDAPLSNVKLNHNRGRSTEGLNYIGGNLYTVELKLEAGMWGFKIYNDTFWVSIPKEKAEQNFTLVYDVNNKARLHVFRTSLLN